MIQFNLLPDVKVELMKAQRLKRITMTISIFVISVSVVILLSFIGVVDIWQKATLNNLNNDINTYTAQINSTPHLSELLTVQNQLKTLPSLFAQRPVAGRLFSFIDQLTPDTATINNLTADFTKNDLTITGQADSLSTVDRFVDTLKLTTYQATAQGAPTNAFSDVVLSSFGFSQTGTSYTINSSFNPAIFSASTNPTLSVPNPGNTRVNDSTPTNLFVQPLPLNNQGGK